MSGPALREQFLVEDLFEPGALNIVATDLDRLAVGAAMPVGELALPACTSSAPLTSLSGANSASSTSARPAPSVSALSPISLDLLDCLYIGIGEQDIVFESVSETPPAFYSAELPGAPEASHHEDSRAPRRSRCCSAATANASERRLNKYIHPGGIRSCQLVMGFTELLPGSVWNTMPAHRHSRRSEIYLYFDLADNLRRSPVRHAHQHAPPDRPRPPSRPVSAMVAARRRGHVQLPLHLGHGGRESELRRHGSHRPCGSFRRATRPHSSSPCRRLNRAVAPPGPRHSRESGSDAAPTT